jgi:tRNA(adenine34) deaminase
LSNSSPTSPDDFWLERALMLAHEAKHRDEVPVGALVIQNHSLIASGFNLRERDHDVSAHAEILALRAAGQTTGDWRLEGATVYVTLEPCTMCLAALQQARVSRVVFGEWDKKAGAISLGYELHRDTRAHSSFIVEHHPLPGSADLLRDYFAQKRDRK